MNQKILFHDASITGLSYDATNTDLLIHLALNNQTKISIQFVMSPEVAKVRMGT